MENTQQNRDSLNTAAIGLVIGTSLGLIFGTMFNQVGLGIALGAALGLVFGFTMPLKGWKTS